MAKKKTPEEVDTPIEGFTQIWEGKIVLSRITTRPEMQVRKDGVDDKTVRDYAKAIEDPMDDLPPMAAFTTATEFNDKCALLMADGHHTITAYKQMGRTTGPFIVYRGDEHDALRYALVKNGQHGKPLTPKDREFAVRLALADSAMKDWSVRKIADMVHCSKSTVQNIKNPPTPKPAKHREPKADPAAPTDNLSNVGQPEEKERFVAEPPTSASTSAGPSIVPTVVRERQESTLPTKNERLVQVKQWADEGYITRADAMNIFSNGSGSLVFVKSAIVPGKKTLIIRHQGRVLIEAEVVVIAELPAIIDVAVEDPREVEYSSIEDPFAA